MKDVKDKVNEVNEVVARLKDKVAQEVATHASEDTELTDLEDVSGGWSITYSTDPVQPTLQPSTGFKQT